MSNANRSLCLLAAACALAVLTACAKPVDDTRNNVVPAEPAAGATADAAPVVAEPAGIANDSANRFVAHGNEPFWAVEVDGTTLTWKTPEMPEGRKLVAERSAHAQGVNFTGKDGDKDFTLDIIGKQCSDGMSDETFEFTASWNYGGNTMTGCARRGN